MEHGSVRSAGDDRLVRQRIAAAAEEGGLDLDLQLPLASAGCDQLRRDSESRLGRTLRLPHTFDLELVFDPPDPVQCITHIGFEIGVGLDPSHGRAEVRDPRAFSGFEPAGELPGRDSRFGCGGA